MPVNGTGSRPYIDSWDSELLLEANRPKVSKEEGFSDDTFSDFHWSGVSGTSEIRTASIRIKQEFFRRMILASYGSKCAITGIADERLLVAGHIIPWSVDAKLRLNPHNGICLNALHDKAFEAGIFTISESFEIIYSKRIAFETKLKLQNLGESNFVLPSRFMPDQFFLHYHRTERFLK